MLKSTREIWKRATQVAQTAAQEENGFKNLVEKLAYSDLTSLWALQQAGDSAIPALLEGLKHSHARVRRNCVDIIDHGGHGGDARCIEALLPMLYDPVPHIRQAVWHTLTCERCRKEPACLGVQPDILSLLVEVGLNDPNLNIRRNITILLGEYLPAPRAKNALESLVERETDTKLRANAQRALSQEKVLL
jgi:HEAT repeat protein